MLSIIISSYQDDFFNNLKENINSTIGVPFEIIKIENNGKMGICEAYNKGASQAKNPYLLFLHEDIIFHTKNWGDLLCKHLQYKNTGVIGVAGGNYIPAAPSNWATDPENNFINIIQNDKSKKKPLRVNSLKQNRSRVYSVDGVFLATTKEVYAKYLFNEKITGFHSYDLDFSLRIAKDYENFIVDDILIEHFSHGLPDKTWFENNLIIRKNLGSNYHKEVKPKLEEQAFLVFLGLFFKYRGINLSNFLKSLQFLPLGKTNIQGYIKILKYYYYIFRFKKSYTKKFNSI